MQAASRKPMACSTIATAGAAVRACHIRRIAAVDRAATGLRVGLAGAKLATEAKLEELMAEQVPPTARAGKLQSTTSVRSSTDHD